MQAATADTVLGDFTGVRFVARGEVTQFKRNDGKFEVQTAGPDGKPAAFEVKYTFGLHPLQQYLVELPGGRLQALGVAWDARMKTQGGQRWFHLNADRAPRPGNPLHWTGLDQNWNYQCADCHSTNVRKNYDEFTNSYATTWSEINVACEACHGPASNHVAWARQEGDWQRVGADKGLTNALDERRGVTWVANAASGTAQRSAPRATTREIDTCARCHARRGQYSDDHAAGRPFHDAFRPALLVPGLYYPDGQQRDEVYDHGSFLQSRMHAQGVSCADCHEPHSQKLRAPGNGVCAQCHGPANYDVPAHHHHAPASTGAQCAACHMPTTTYMSVDPRHDHSLRIPRPDRSATLGVPNPCTQCHAKRDARWAADTIARWFPDRKPGFQSFAEAFAAAERGEAGASQGLLDVVRDKAQPAIVRASAIDRLARDPLAPRDEGVRAALDDSDPGVRAAAVRALARLEPVSRAQTLGRMLDDRSRLVRIDAAHALAGEAERSPGIAGASFQRALGEYVAALRFNADRPEAQASLGNLHASRGQEEEAIAAYQKAIALDPTFVEASVNLADLHRASGRETAAEQTLRDALARNPGAAIAHHTLGLSLIRQKRRAEAVAELATANRLAPADARFAYVYAVALHDTGRLDDALATLERALARLPYDRQLLFALAVYTREKGDLARSGNAVRRLQEVAPGDPEVLALKAALDRDKR